MRVARGIGEGRSKEGLTSRVGRPSRWVRGWGQVEPAREEKGEDGEKEEGRGGEEGNSLARSPATLSTLVLNPPRPHGRPSAGPVRLNGLLCSSAHAGFFRGWRAWSSGKEATSMGATCPADRHLCSFHLPS